MKRKLILIMAAAVAYAVALIQGCQAAQSVKDPRTGNIVPVTTNQHKGSLLIPGKQESKETARWIDNISIAPVGVIKTHNITGESQWGAGLDVAAKVNPFVSIHVVNLAFEGGDSEFKNDPNKKAGRDSSGGNTGGSDLWGGTAIDETLILVKAKLADLYKDRLSLYGIAGGVRDWENERWGVSIGGGLELTLSKHFSIASEYSVRPYFKAVDGSSKDGLLALKTVFSF